MNKLILLAALLGFTAGVSLSWGIYSIAVIVPCVITLGVIIAITGESK